MNGWVAPTAIDAVAGVSARLASVAGVVDDELHPLANAKSARTTPHVRTSIRKVCLMMNPPLLRVGLRRGASSRLAARSGS